MQIFKGNHQISFKRRIIFDRKKKFNYGFRNISNFFFVQVFPNIMANRQSLKTKQTKKQKIFTYVPSIWTLVFGSKYLLRNKVLKYDHNSIVLCFLLCLFWDEKQM